jgi:hypothetical protein
VNTGIPMAKDAHQNFNCNLIISKHLAKAEAQRPTTSKSSAAFTMLTKVISNAVFRVYAGPYASRDSRAGWRIKVDRKLPAGFQNLLIPE